MNDAGRDGGRQLKRTVEKYLTDPPRFATRAKPPPRRGEPDQPTTLVPVYRVQLVEERKIAVERAQVRTTAQAARLVDRYMDRPDREMFVVVLLDDCCAVMGLHTAHIGCLESTPADPRDIYKPAILRNASRIVVAHNHVDGPVRPSRDDRALTVRLAKAGEALGVKLNDHIIIGKSWRDRYSFLDAGLL